MIIIGLTGLHRAGKSYFRYSRVSESYGYNVVNKKELIVKLCRSYYLSKNIDLDETIKKEIISKGLESNDKQFMNLFNNLIWKISNEWFGEQMYTNAQEVLYKLIKLANQLYGSKIVLDAIHNNLEWAVISDFADKQGLIYFNTSRIIRERRPGELNNDVVSRKNIKRIGYWFNDKSLPSLISSFSWCISGTEDILLNGQSFALLVRCIENDISLNNVRLLLTKDCQYSIYDYKSEIIDDLCEEVMACNPYDENLHLRLIKEKNAINPCYGIKKQL